MPSRRCTSESSNVLQEVQAVALMSSTRRGPGAVYRNPSTKRSSARAPGRVEKRGNIDRRRASSLEVGPRCRDVELAADDDQCDEMMINDD
jgi:hypothetical protein